MLMTSLATPVQGLAPNLGAVREGLNKYVWRDDLRSVTRGGVSAWLLEIRLGSFTGASEVWSGPEAGHMRRGEREGRKWKPKQ